MLLILLVQHRFPLGASWSVRLNLSLDRRQETHHCKEGTSLVRSETLVRNGVKCKVSSRDTLP